MAHWLMKSEPEAYGIDDLAREGETLWDGIRNYQARNFMRSMVLGDRAFFYHSNTNPPGIVGLMEVTQTGLVDPSQFDPASKYHDPASSPNALAGTARACATWVAFRTCSASRCCATSSAKTSWGWCVAATGCRSCRCPRPARHGCCSCWAPC